MRFVAGRQTVHAVQAQQDEKHQPWTYEEDQILLRVRDGFGTTGQYGEYRDHSFNDVIEALLEAGYRRGRNSCIGRWHYILQESEEALANAQRMQRTKHLEERRRLVGELPVDPYEPRPDWFEKPTPFQVAREFFEAQREAERLKVEREKAKVEPRPAPRVRVKTPEQQDLANKRKRDKRRADPEAVRAADRQRDRSHRRVGYDPANPTGSTAVVRKPRHYRPNWTDDAD